MSFDDWKSNFTELQMCHLTPESPTVFPVSDVNIQMH